MGAIKKWSSTGTPDDFYCVDFDNLWHYGDQKTCERLEKAIFDLLENWAFDTDIDTCIESRRSYLMKNIFPLGMWKKVADETSRTGGGEELMFFPKLKYLAEKQMKKILLLLYKIRDNIAEDSEGGKRLIGGDVPSIKGDMSRMTIGIAHDISKAGRNSERMRQEVDSEVLVPLIRATANEILDDFKEILHRVFHSKDVVYVEDPKCVTEVLKENPNWECWYTVAPVKSTDRIKEKMERYATDKHSWPLVTHIGDCIRAMVVCKSCKESGNILHRTWKQLEDAFNISKDHGRLKNNFATAGIQDPKPPDMLINGVLDIEGAMVMPMEIQIHHEEIYRIKESKVHLLYEIVRAKSIDILQDGGQVGTAICMQQLKDENKRLKVEIESLKENYGKKSKVSCMGNVLWRSKKR